MRSGAFDGEVAQAIEQLHANLQALSTADLRPTNLIDAQAQIADLETLGAMLDAVRVKSLAALDETGLHRGLGHSRASVMVRHEAKLSGAEARGREQVRKVVAELPELAQRYAAGKIGSCQVRRIARTWANVRVQDKMRTSERRIVNAAMSMPFDLFHAWLVGWEHRADQDGSLSDVERQHENRHATLVQDYDGSWHLSGGFAPAQGARVREIFDAFIRAEHEVDLEKARAGQADPADPLVLPRTARQRRADALEAMAMDAAAVPAGTVRPDRAGTVVIDHETFDRELARLDGLPVPDDDPDRSSYRCETLDGYLLHPTEIVLSALQCEYRRVVLGADGTVLDQGLARGFTGATRTAVQISRNQCYWPGCDAPVSVCQIDHLQPHRKRGRTNPGNGAPLCGRHNRHKEHGRYRVERRPNGELRITNPAGVEVT